MKRTPIERRTALGTHRLSSANIAWLAALLALAVTSGCVTVRPEERAVLSDPKMRFQGDPKAAAQLEHALANREGSFGGGSVQGGGCGCN